LELESDQFFSGRLFLCEKQGKLRLVKNNVLLDQPAVTLTNVYSNNECGLLGVVLDPDFASNGYFYLYYTYTNGSNYPRVSRFTLEADTVVPNSEVVIFELEKISTTAGVHNGGSIIIDASGTLFMFVGNIGSGPLSASLTTSYGKVLRFNLDGSIPQDNPFYDTATGRFKIGSK
jgi:glucose/arabinose dehydrogenase